MFALSPDAPPALPFWIDGRAVLSLGERLVDVQNPRQEPVLRRVPVCDAAVAQRAVAAACAAQPAWAALDPALRQGVLAALATALAGYAPHFARLLGEDAGLTATAAAEDVARAEQAGADVDQVRAVAADGDGAGGMAHARSSGFCHCAARRTTRCAVAPAGE